MIRIFELALVVVVVEVANQCNVAAKIKAEDQVSWRSLVKSFGATGTGLFPSNYIVVAGLFSNHRIVF